MGNTFPIYSPQFFTATIYEWQIALADNYHKDIIIESLKFLIAKKRIELNAFAEKNLVVYAWVIMSNHVHLS